MRHNATFILCRIVFFAGIAVSITLPTTSLFANASDTRTDHGTCDLWRDQWTDNTPSLASVSLDRSASRIQSVELDYFPVDLSRAQSFTKILPEGYRFTPTDLVGLWREQASEKGLRLDGAIATTQIPYREQTLILLTHFGSNETLCPQILVKQENESTIQIYRLVDVENTHEFLQLPHDQQIYLEHSNAVAKLPRSEKEIVAALLNQFNLPIDEPLIETPWEELSGTELALFGGVTLLRPATQRALRRIMGRTYSSAYRTALSSSANAARLTGRALTNGLRRFPMLWALSELEPYLIPNAGSPDLPLEPTGENSLFPWEWAQLERTLANEIQDISTDTRRQQAAEEREAKQRLYRLQVPDKLQNLISFETWLLHEGSFRNIVKKVWQMYYAMRLNDSVIKDFPQKSQEMFRLFLALYSRDVPTELRELITFKVWIRARFISRGILKVAGQIVNMLSKQQPGPLFLKELSFLKKLDRIIDRYEDVIDDPDDAYTSHREKYLISQKNQ